MVSSNKDERVECVDLSETTDQAVTDPEIGNTSDDVPVVFPLPVLEPCVEKIPEVVKGNKVGERPYYSSARRWILFVFAFLTTSLVSGVIYGWPALRHELLQEGSTLTETQFGAIFTIGSFSTKACRLFLGLARDRAGTRSVAIFSFIFTALGALGIAFADASNSAKLSVSMFVLSFCAGTQLTVQPVASLFPGYSSTVVSSLSGAFQISGLVFLGLTSAPNMSRKQAFLIYALIAALMAVLSWFLLPHTASFDEVETCTAVMERSGHTVMEMSGHTTARESIGNTDKKVVEDDVIENGTGLEVETDHPPTLLQQVLCLEYLCLLAWFCISLVPLQYYIGSIGFQLERKGDINGKYTELFAIIYASAAVTAPAGGYISDCMGLGFTQGIASLMTASSYFILASDSISLKGQILGLALYSIGRMFIFSMFFSNVGKRMGFTNFGTLTGLGLLASAFCSLLQLPLITAASNGHARSINIASGAVFIGLVPYCVWLSLVERKSNRARSWLE